MMKRAALAGIAGTVGLLLWVIADPERASASPLAILALLFPLAPVFLGGLALAGELAAAVGLEAARAAVAWATGASLEPDPRPARRAVDPAPSGE